MEDKQLLKPVKYILPALGVVLVIALVVILAKSMSTAKEVRELNKQITNETSVIQENLKSFESLYDQELNYADEMLAGNSYTGFDNKQLKSDMDKAIYNCKTAEKNLKGITFSEKYNRMSTSRDQYTAVLDKTITCMDDVLSAATIFNGFYTEESQFAWRNITAQGQLADRQQIIIKRYKELKDAREQYTKNVDELNGFSFLN